MSSLLARVRPETGDADAADGPAATNTPDAVGDDLAEAAAATASPAEALPLDVAFDVLQNSRRRQVLHLVMAEESTTLSDVSEQIAALENDKPRDQLDSQERKRVYVGLYQCHLPRLDDVGVVEFDEDRGTVEAGPHAEELYGYLATTTEAEESTASRELCLSVGAVVGVMLTAAVATAAPVALPAVVGVALVGAGAAIAHRLFAAPQ